MIVQSDSGENKIKFEPRVKTSKIWVYGLGFFVFFFPGGLRKGFSKGFYDSIIGGFCLIFLTFLPIFSNQRRKRCGEFKLHWISRRS